MFPGAGALLRLERLQGAQHPFWFGSDAGNNCSQLRVRNITLNLGGVEPAVWYGSDGVADRQHLRVRTIARAVAGCAVPLDCRVSILHT
jgi:hypothetical protein